MFYFDIIGFKSVFELVQSLTPADDLRKKTLLGCYGSNFKYTEFQVMSSIASVVMYTVAMAFGLGMLLVDPVSLNDAESFFFFFPFANFYQIRYLVKKIVPQSGEGPSEE